MRRIYFDTETSGFGKKDWICQLAFIYESDDRVIAECSTLIRSDGRPMGKKAQEIHGIPAAIADLGLSQRDAIEFFFKYVQLTELSVCHNFSFDARMITQITGALGFLLEANTFAARPHVCTMRESTEWCRLPKATGRGYKWPKLSELHQALFNEDFSGAHDALADVKATRRCYHELRKRGIIE